MSLKKNPTRGTIKKGGKNSSLQSAVKSRRDAALTMLADTAYVWFWVMVTWLFNTYCLEPFGKMAGVDKTVLTIMQIASSIPTILQAIAFAVVDISELVRGTVVTVRKQWK